MNESSELYSSSVGPSTACGARQDARTGCTQSVPSEIASLGCGAGSQTSTQGLERPQETSKASSFTENRPSFFREDKDPFHGATPRPIGISCWECACGCIVVQRHPR